MGTTGAVGGYGGAWPADLVSVLIVQFDGIFAEQHNQTDCFEQFLLKSKEIIELDLAIFKKIYIIIP